MIYKEPKKKRNNIIIGKTTSFLIILIKQFRRANQVTEAFLYEKNVCS